MIVTIHQPSFFPWLGWLHKIKSADTYIFQDDVQIAERAYQHRNIFLTNGGQEKYLSVGIVKKGFLDVPMKDIQLNEQVKWQKEHLNFFKGNYSNHPFYKEVMEAIMPVYSTSYATLGEVLKEVLDITLSLFDIQVKVLRQSEMDYDKEAKKLHLVLELVRAAYGTTYLSGTGAKDYMDDNLFTENGIQVVYQQFKHPQYPQKNTGNDPEKFMPGMGSLDLLFNIGIEESRKLLHAL